MIPFHISWVWCRQFWFVKTNMCVKCKCHCVLPFKIQEPCQWWEASYTCLFTEIHFTYEFSTSKLKLFTRLTTLIWHLDGSHAEGLQQTLGHLWHALIWNPNLSLWRGSLRIVKNSNSCFWTPKPWFVMNISLVNILPLLISHFEHGHEFTLAQVVDG